MRAEVHPSRLSIIRQNPFFSVGYRSDLPPASRAAFEHSSTYAIWRIPIPAAAG